MNTGAGSRGYTTGVPEIAPPKFVVVKVPSDAGERFVVVDTAKWAARPFRFFATPGSTEERLGEIVRSFQELPHLTEDEVRAELTARGESPPDIERWFERARKVVELGASAPSIAFETITRIGYRNKDGQEVIRKTEQSGPGHQRVFVMRCGVCGHEYGSYGCDADIRRCPSCQDGAPEISVV